MNVVGSPNAYWPYPSAAEPELSVRPFDLRANIAMVWRGRWIIAGTLVVALTAALLTISQMRPVYTASAKMMFEDGRRNVADLEEVVRSNYNGETLHNEIEVLVSSSLIGNVVDALEGGDAARSAVTATAKDTAGGAPRLLSDLGLISRPSAEAMDPATRRRNEAIDAIQSGLRLRPVPRSRVIALAYTDPDPQRAARVVNEITQQYIRTRLEQKLAATRSASGWLAERIRSLRAKVAKAELAVEEARAGLSSEAGQSAAITRQQLAELSGALARARAERARLDTQHSAAAGALGAAEIDLGTISLFRDAGVIRALRGVESELVSRDAALASMARDSPNRARIKAELDLVRRSIREEAQRIVAALENDIDIVAEQEISLQRELAALEAVERTQRRGEVELRQLEREAEASRVLYESFLARLQETEQQETLLSPDAFVLSPAQVPTVPQGRGQKRVLIVALILGLGAGVGLTILLERLNNTFRSVRQVEAATGASVLALLPAMGRRGARVDDLAAVRQWWPDGQLAEAVRNLRTSILLGVADGAPSVVMFTSSVSGEGKSTSAYLLALTSLQLDRRVIIVDADLRLRAISGLVQRGADSPGLLAALTGEAPLDEAITHDAETGLDILATPEADLRGLAGGVSNAADLIGSPRFGDLIGRLSERYDLVIIDTPPVLAVTDARIVSRLADAVVFAVKWDATSRDAVEKGLRELEGVKAPLAGIVLTMVSEPDACPYAQVYADRVAEEIAPSGAAMLGRVARRLQAGVGPALQRVLVKVGAWAQAIAARPRRTWSPETRRSRGRRQRGPRMDPPAAAGIAPHRGTAAEPELPNRGVRDGSALQRPADAGTQPGGLTDPASEGRGAPKDDLPGQLEMDRAPRPGHALAGTTALETMEPDTEAQRADACEAREGGARDRGLRSAPALSVEAGQRGVEEEAAPPAALDPELPQRGSADRKPRRRGGADAELPGRGAMRRETARRGASDPELPQRGARRAQASAAAGCEEGASDRADDGADWMPAPRLGQAWRSGKPRAP